MNDNLKTVIIAPMTTKSHDFPTRIKVFHNDQQVWIVIDQISTTDKSRIIKIMGKLSIPEVNSCKLVLKETLVD